MKNWKCRNCGLYIRVDKDKIKVGNVIVFSKVVLIQRYKKMKLAQGVVVGREQEKFKVLHEGAYYFLEKDEVYPADAPVFFLYNMFGECKCLPKNAGKRLR